eukprot:TRINITY_DN67571_c7_g8_i1.p1 TRINITY_DN67571_c7_g8~~TRINITY_DN67571_c7_g8_i1.p1  ORF type:complete len:299 (+),score=13.15 TRINITY_DN67571_c7_g8_i1:100-996(+)
MNVENLPGSVNSSTQHDPSWEDEPVPKNVSHQATQKGNRRKTHPDEDLNKPETWRIPGVRSSQASQKIHVLFQRMIVPSLLPFFDWPTMQAYMCLTPRAYDIACSASVYPKWARDRLRDVLCSHGIAISLGSREERDFFWKSVLTTSPSLTSRFSGVDGENITLKSELLDGEDRNSSFFASKTEHWNHTSLTGVTTHAYWTLLEQSGKVLKLYKREVGFTSDCEQDEAWRRAIQPKGCHLSMVRQSNGRSEWHSICLLGVENEGKIFMWQETYLPVAMWLGMAERHGLQHGWVKGGAG